MITTIIDFYHDVHHRQTSQEPILSLDWFTFITIEGILIVQYPNGQFPKDLVNLFINCEWINEMINYEWID